MGFSKDEFADDLKGCSAVICTAGHQLLTELQHLGKPVLCLPFMNYEQCYNAEMVVTAGTGQVSTEFTYEDISRFIDCRTTLAAAAREHADLLKIRNDFFHTLDSVLDDGI